MRFVLSGRTTNHCSVIHDYIYFFKKNEQNVLVVMNVVADIEDDENQASPSRSIMALYISIDGIY